MAIIPRARRFEIPLDIVHKDAFRNRDSKPLGHQ